MLGILIFDQLNDLIYIKCDHSFLRHLQGMAIAQGLTSPSEINNVPAVVEPNLVVQLFSPLITSHHVMDVQFNNPYMAIACHDGTTIALQKYESYIFVCIGQQEEDWLQRLLSIVIRLSKLLVGPCIAILRSSQERRALLGQLVWTWVVAAAEQQCYLVEAVERLLVGPDVTAAVIQVLSEVLDKMKSASQDCVSSSVLQPCHALLLVNNKLLALYSSRSAQELSAADILLLNLLVSETPTDGTACADGGVLMESLLHEELTLGNECGLAQEEESDCQQQQQNTLQTVTLEQLEGEEVLNLGVSCHSAMVLLTTELSVFTPHLVHCTSLYPNISLVVVSEIGRSRLSGSTMSLLQCVSSLVPPAGGCSGGGGGASLDVCEATLLQTLQLARKLPPGANTDAVARALQKVEQQWHYCKTAGLAEWQQQQQHSSAGDGDGCEIPSRLEAALTALQESIRSAWHHTSLPYLRNTGNPAAAAVAQHSALYAKEKLASYAQFIEVKALANPKFECRALSVNRYMDDFPGLVHFIYVDRSTHQMTAPSLDFVDFAQPLQQNQSDSSTNSGKEDMAAACCATKLLTKKRVWAMVEFARSSLSAGQHSVMWKDTTFSYAYFLWFEDRSGVAKAPEELDEDVLAALPRPGILTGDFYKLLTAHSFSGSACGVGETPRCCEVLCVHLGLVTAPCVLEQTRRLLSSVWEIAGESGCDPGDLL